MSERIGAARKILVGARVWWTFLTVVGGLRHQPLPELVQHLSRTPKRPARPLDPKRMGRIVGRALRIGPWRPRCLFSALTLYRLLRLQGDPAELLIGLPDRPVDKDAHAWVEVRGFDVGPPPGRARHETFARYGSTGPIARP